MYTLCNTELEHVEISLWWTKKKKNSSEAIQHCTHHRLSRDKVEGTITIETTLAVVNKNRLNK